MSRNVDARQKLNPDPLAEALLEIQFSSKEFPEFVTTKLAAADLASGFSVQRLPLADMPGPIRRQDPTLRYAATVAMNNDSGTRIAKIGEQVFSWHCLNEYPGWEILRLEFEKNILHLFRGLTGLTVTRLGLRYINALSQTRHFIDGVKSLNVKITVDEEPLNAPLNLNYQRVEGIDIIAMVKVASPEFVQGNFTKDYTALIDIDVFTPSGYEATDPAEIISWCDRAHTFSKTQFFSLMTDDFITRLGEGK